MKIRIITSVPLDNKSGALIFDRKTQPDEYHYLVNVLRVYRGKKVYFFSGKDPVEYEFEVQDIAKNAVSFGLVDKIAKNIIDRPAVVLVFAPPKNTTENIIRQATEIGVSRFVPILTERTVVRNINKIRWEKIAKEASEQSERMDCPIVGDLQNLDSFLANLHTTDRLLFCDETSACGANNSFGLADVNYVLIGPEGGFTPKERDLILSRGASILNLGANILKVDTACIVALSKVILGC